MIGDFLQSVGASTLGWLRYINQLYWFFIHVVVVFFTGGRRGARVTDRTTLYQIYFTGFDALVVTGLLAMVFGVLTVVSMTAFLSGGGELVGRLMDLLVIRQIGPLMTAFIVIGRSASSIAVELGYMKVLGEIDLLEAMGIDPHRFLVLPRMFGVTIAVLGLTVFFDVMAMLGAVGVTTYRLGTPADELLINMSTHINPAGLWEGLIKSALFGLVIATISTWQGLSVEGAITEVPQANRRCVVHSIVACVGLHALVTLFFLWVL